MLAETHLAPRIVSIKRLARAADSLTTEGKIGPKDVTVTIDTGAAVTLVRNGVLDPCCVNPPTSTMFLQTATGEKVPVLGEAVVNLALGRFQLRHKVLVADIKDDLILGLDVISRHGLSRYRKQNAENWKRRNHSLHM